MGSATQAINCGRIVGQRSTSGHRGSASPGKRQNELHRGKQYTEHEESRVSRLWLPPETPQVNEPNDPPFPKTRANKTELLSRHRSTPGIRVPCGSYRESPSASPTHL